MALLLQGSEFLEFSGWTVPDATTGIVSVSYWFRPTNLAFGLQRIWGSASHMEDRTATDGTLTSDIFEDAGTHNYATLVADDTTHFVCSTGDANTDTLRLHLDGFFDAEYLTATGIDVGTVLQIGNRPGAALAQAFIGIIEDWRSYDRVLTEPEIATLYHARGHDGIVDGLTCRFMFDDGAPGSSVVTLNDISGNGVAVSSITGTPTFTESLGLSPRKFV